MIITKIRLQEERPMTGATDSWPLPICDLHLDSSAGDNGYIIKDSTGLEPPEINEIVEGFDIYGTPAINDISENREIVLKIGFRPGIGQSYSSLRDNLYKLISRNVFVKLMNESIVIAQTSGSIHRFESVLFSNKPEVQITIQCQEGEFSAPQAIDIPFADLASAAPVIVYEEGTAPTGFELQFTCDGSMASFSIFNHSRVHSLDSAILYNLFQITYPMIADDLISISTQPKNKYIRLLRGATTYDLAGYINAGAVWPKLYPGVNTFEWDLDSGIDWVAARYIPKYWGV